MLRNGGRNGIALTAGFRWALGKEPAKVQNTEPVRTSSIKTQPTKVVLKQLSPSQKTAMGSKLQNTTRTLTMGVLK